MSKPTVAIVGRPNVGKSTLFNRILGGRPAIVSDRPGTTRDRHFGDAEWQGRRFWVVDTGGLVPESDDSMDRAIRQQVEFALAESDVVVFLVDGKEGVHPVDQAISERLRRAQGAVVLAVNKLDDLERSTAQLDFYELGFGEPLGARYAIPVGLFDIAKGAVPVLVFAPQASDSQLFALACGIAAIVGHVFSVFVRFRGGKGVATAAGVMLGLTPLALGVAALVWLVLVALTGYVSLASIVAAAVLPVAVYLLERPDRPEILWLDALVAAAIIWLHRANIRRLLNGTENRFGRRAAPPARP